MQGDVRRIEDAVTDSPPCRSHQEYPARSKWRWALKNPPSSRIASSSRRYQRLFCFRSIMMEGPRRGQGTLSAGRSERVEVLRQALFSETSGNILVHPPSQFQVSGNPAARGCISFKSRQMDPPNRLKVILRRRSHPFRDGYLIPVAFEIRLINPGDRAKVPPGNFHRYRHRDVTARRIFVPGDSGHLRKRRKGSRETFRRGGRHDIRATQNEV